MAEENQNMAAGEGTGISNPTGDSNSGCLTWDNLGGGTELPPFFSPREELKRQGFTVRFLTDKPRKETPSAFDSRSMELWFDIEYQGRLMTWTISQISLLLELKKHAPLKGKDFFIQLVPVDEEFRRVRPQYKGKDRYLVKEALAEAAEHSSASLSASPVGGMTAKLSQALPSEMVGKFHYSNRG